jgi:hypothetical protein
MNAALATTSDADLLAVRRHRAELRESIDSLEKALAAPAPGRVEDWARRVQAALEVLAADFTTHIDVTEGRDGLYRGVLATAPRLGHGVDRLVREHAEIREIVDDLLTVVTRAHDADGVDAVRDCGTALLGRLLRHRQRGADLVYEAYQSDIGGET